MVWRWRVSCRGLSASAHGASPSKRHLSLHRSWTRLIPICLDLWVSACRGIANRRPKKHAKTSALPNATPRRRGLPIRITNAVWIVVLSGVATSADAHPRNNHCPVWALGSPLPRRRLASVARVERSETRGSWIAETDPDFASLNPGYSLVEPRIATTRPNTSHIQSPATCLKTLAIRRGATIYSDGSVRLHIAETSRRSQLPITPLTNINGFKSRSRQRITQSGIGTSGGLRRTMQMENDGHPTTGGAILGEVLGNGTREHRSTISISSPLSSLI